MKIKKKNQIKKNHGKEVKVKKLSKNEINRQLGIIFFVMAVLIVFILAIWFSLSEFTKFRYGGLKFEKISYGELKLYHAKIPIVSVTGQLVANYNLFLRADPRKLDNIEIEDQISLGKTVILASEDFSMCEDTNIAGSALGQYLGFAGITKINAELNKSVADSKDRTYLNCSQQLNYTALAFKKGEETRIYLENQCYIVSVKDCDILNATERLMVAIYANHNGIII